jgi:hypothetical protein
LLFATFWAGAPAPSEVFYWHSGAFEYGVPFLLLILSLRLLARAVAGETSLVFGLAAGAVGALAAGAHEMAGLILVPAALGAAIASWYLGRKRALLPCLAAVALAAAGLAVNLLAPGNAARAAIFPHGGSIVRGAALTLGFRDAPLGWFFDLRLIALSLLLLVLPPFCRVRPAWTRLELPWLAILPVLTLGCASLMWFLAAYSLGFPPPGRLKSFLYGLYVIAWAAAALVLAARTDAGAREAPLLQTGAAATFALALLLAQNTRAGVRDLPLAHGAWLRENRQQLADIVDARRRGETDILLRRLPAPPRLLMARGLPADPRRVENQSMATLMGVRTVRAPADQDAPRRIWRGE